MKLGIVTPVGPGHQEAYEACLQSIQQAWEHDQGGFSELEILPMWDLQGEFGRSRRRNDGIAIAAQKNCDWIFFLDADDLMSATAFEEAAPYLDDYDAIWGNICEMPFGKFDQVRLRGRQLKTTENVDDILKIDPYLTLQMGHFVKTACAASVGFEEAMNTGEDFRYYLQVCGKYRFIKAPCIFFINQRGNHSQGPLSADGNEWRAAVQREIRHVLASRELSAEIKLADSRSVFHINNPFDIIQRCLCQGAFFEQAELLALKDYVGERKVIVEVGANIGNHTVFYAHHMNPARIFPFEPNPHSVALLDKNIRLNRLEGLIDRRGIGFGLGSSSRNCHVVQSDMNNLGAARLEEGGDIQVRTLDEVMHDEPVDFIKIDAEGMEFEVLAGGSACIAKNRPLIHVEVWNQGVPQFEAWMRENRYKLITQVKMVNAVNFLIGPQ
ncbi:MAG TPA: FkbM family methyltransferase [Burkholderiales bacterium]|nr:FkbM family methyltransferase [Burkholderiales bacterium]